MRISGPPYLASCLLYPEFLSGVLQQGCIAHKLCLLCTSCPTKPPLLPSKGLSGQGTVGWQGARPSEIGGFYAGEGWEDRLGGRGLRQSQSRALAMPGCLLSGEAGVVSLNWRGREGLELGGCSVLR